MNETNETMITKECWTACPSAKTGSIDADLTV
jgi:hypothetical protein